jgi:hypothetical protein
MRDKSVVLFAISVKLTNYLSTSQTRTWKLYEATDQQLLLSLKELLHLLSKTCLRNGICPSQTQCPSYCTLKMRFLERIRALVLSLQGRIALDIAEIFPKTPASVLADAFVTFKTLRMSFFKAVNFSLAPEKTMVLDDMAQVKQSLRWMQHPKI